MKGKSNVSHTTLQPEVKTCAFPASLTCTLSLLFSPTRSEAVENGPGKLEAGAWKPTALYNVIFSNGEWAEGMAHWRKRSLNASSRRRAQFSRTQVENTAGVTLPCNPSGA